MPVCVAAKQEAKADEGAILELKKWGSLLVYTTEPGRIHGWDLRTGRETWVIGAKASQVDLHFLSSGRIMMT